MTNTKPDRPTRSKNVRRSKPGQKPGGTGRKPPTRRTSSTRSVKRPTARPARVTSGRTGTSPKKSQVKKPAGTGRKPVRVTRKKQVKRTETSTMEDLKWVEEDPKDHLLSLFIKDAHGKVIGESIGVEGRYIIMKSGLKFYSIPLKNVVEGEMELILKGRINRPRARKLGEQWRKRALDPLYQKKKK